MELQRNIPDEFKPARLQNVGNRFDKYRMKLSYNTKKQIIVLICILIIVYCIYKWKNPFSNPNESDTKNSSNPDEKPNNPAKTQEPITSLTV